VGCGETLSASGAFVGCCIVLVYKRTRCFADHSGEMSLKHTQTQLIDAF